MAIRKITKEQADIICKMDEQLRNILSADKLWENTYIKRQIDKRNENGSFSINDHIRAIVYSMLSGGTAWDRVAKETDSKTGYITSVDKIFRDYNPKELLKCSPEQLQEELKEIRLTSRYTSAQISALLDVNIPKLMEWEKEYKTVDNYYQRYMESDCGLVAPGISLVKALSAPDSKYKLAQMGEALVCEYLRNIGYDFPKPDRHICRILGRDSLTFSTNVEVPRLQAFQIIFKLAKLVGKSVAETDYILWSYCATGYGEICTVDKPVCDVCVASKQCRKQTGDVLNVLKSKLLLDSYYEVTETDSVSEIICKAADMSYKTFRRRIYFGKDVPVEDRTEVTQKVKSLLIDRIPELLKSTDQAMFDETHHKICEEIIGVYDRVCRQSYGIAQRWLNQTLLNLMMIESSLKSSKLPVMQARKYFHVPVNEDVLKVATTESKDKFLNSLGLQAAPLKHEDTAAYKMGWYVPGTTQPFEKWEYAEYIEFQNAVRSALQSSIKAGIYKDVADWIINVLAETK